MRALPDWLRGFAAMMGHISLAVEQPRNRNIFIQRVPMNSPQTEVKIIALFGSRRKQARKPCQRNAKRAPVLQFNPEVILIDSGRLR